MLEQRWRIGVVLLMAACGNPTSNQDSGRAVTQYDVTERGVVKPAQATLEPGFRTYVHDASPQWLAIRSGNHIPVYLPTSHANPDLSTVHFGRSDLEFPRGRTPVGIELSGLDWHSGDSLQLVSPNIGLSIHGLEAHFTAPDAQATTISGQTVDWANAGAALVDSAKGDRTWIAQMAIRPTVSGSHYSVLSRAGVADGFRVSDGSPSTLRATLAAVNPDRELVVRWRGSAFAALAKEAGPNVRSAPAPALSIRTLPEAAANESGHFASLYMYLPSVVDFGPIRGDQDFEQRIRYGNPFANRQTRWSEFVTMVYAMPVTIAGVGVTHALIVQASPVADLAGGGEIAPALSPVRNVKIDGRSLTTPQLGVGATPTVTWEAPALGTATSYAVTVARIVPRGSGHKLEPTGKFMTSETRLTVPAFATDKASAYVLTITAIATKNRDLLAKPLAGGLPFASADYVTAEITP